MISKPVNDFTNKILFPYAKQSDQKRTACITNNRKTPGVIWLKSSTKLSVLYKLRSVVQGAENLLLGTASNNVATPRPRLIATDITHSILVAVDKSSVPACVETGKDIDKKHPKLGPFFCDSKGAPTDTETKVVARIPVSMPIAQGSRIQSGTVDQATYDCCDDIDTSLLPFWLKYAQAWDNGLQSLLLTEADCKDFLPSKPNMGHSYAKSPYVSFTPIQDDDSDLEDAVETLEGECNDIAKDNMTRSVEEELSMGSPAGRRKSSLPGLGSEVDIIAVSPVNAKAQAISEAENYNARLYAFGAVFDPASGTVDKPTLSDFVPTMRDQSSKVNRRENAVSAMSSIEDTLADGDHYLGRQTDLPKFDNVTAAFIGNATFSKDPVKTLGINASDGVTLPMLMPDSASTAAEKADAAFMNHAEDALGEHESRKSKLATTFTSVNELVGMPSLLGTMANVMIWMLLYYKFDMSSISVRPSCATYIIGLADIASSKRARKWLREHPQLKQQFLYYVLNSTISIVTAFAQASRDVMVTSNILNDPDKVPKRHFETAYRIYHSISQDLERVFLNSLAIPEVVIWTSSLAKARLDEKEEKKLLAKLNVSDGKRKQSDANLARGGGFDKIQKQGNKTGFIKTLIANMSVPSPLFNANFKICKANAKDGTICPMGDKCKKDHRHIEKLERDKAKAWVKSVDSSNDYNFINVDSKWLAEIREEISKD